jgi:hypothetical protein
MHEIDVKDEEPKMKPCPCHCKIGLHRHISPSVSASKEGPLPPHSSSKNVVPSEDGEAHPRAHMETTTRPERQRPFIWIQDHNKRATPMIATKPHHYGYYTYDLTDASRRQCFCETPHMDYPNA